MKLATVVVCLLSVVSWLSLASATPFMPNFFKEGKDAFLQAMGGENNPFIKHMQEMEKMFGTDEWQQKFHDTMVQGMEQATGKAKEQMEGWMQKFTELKDSNADKSEFEKLAKEMQSKMMG